MRTKTNLMKRICICITALLFTTFLHAKDPADSLLAADEAYNHLLDSITTSLHWQTSQVNLSGAKVTLTLPKEFKYLDAAQSRTVLHKLWGNPERDDVLGMIFPANANVYTDSSYAFIITFDEDGYVKDEDANKIDYKDMLWDIRKSEKEANPEREKNGYQPIHMVGWASQPFYDKDRKVLHWAKELQFGDDSLHTLNYDVRVLGRKGVLSLNAVAGMGELALVKSNIDKVLQIAAFTEGNRYQDYNSSTDKVAEYGIGALVAGGVLAKTGVLAAIGKGLIAAWKFIVIGFVAIAGAIRKFFKGKAAKKDDYDERIKALKPE